MVPFRDVHVLGQEVLSFCHTGTDHQHQPRQGLARVGMSKPEKAMFELGKAYKHSNGKPESWPATLNPSHIFG